MAEIARSAWAGDFAERVAFADVGRRPRSFTTYRADFLGRNGVCPERPPPSVGWNSPTEPTACRHTWGVARYKVPKPSDGEIPLMDDGRAHAVRVELR